MNVKYQPIGSHHNSRRGESKIASRREKRGGGKQFVVEKIMHSVDTATRCGVEKLAHQAVFPHLNRRSEYLPTQGVALPIRMDACAEMPPVRWPTKT